MCELRDEFQQKKEKKKKTVHDDVGWLIKKLDYHLD
jgi:hypothetical protein